jgi:hypothetical protein
MEHHRRVVVVEKPLLGQDNFTAALFLGRGTYDLDTPAKLRKTGL